MLKCKFCNRDCKNANSLRNHQRLCPINPNKQISSLVKYKKDNPLPWNTGLKGDARCVISESTREKLKGSSGKALTSEKELLRVSKIRSKIITRYAEGWEPTCGRCKKYDYYSPIAGHIKVDGTWELKAAEYLDSIGVIWNRNRTRFNYTNPIGRISTYQPDFYVETWGCYLEVKGYETDLDRCKWSQFPSPLLIWRKKEILNLGNVSAGS